MGETKLVQLILVLWLFQTFKLGRQRSSLPGKRKATLGTQEVEREES